MDTTDNDAVDVTDGTGGRGILGKLLQRLDALTLSIADKKKELDSYANKAQEAADTLDVASTKLISSFTEVANLEQTLQETIARGIEGAADRIAQQASHEIGQQLQEAIGRLNDSAHTFQRNNLASHSAIKRKRWLWIGAAVFFGMISASVTTGGWMWWSDPARSELNQKLIKYGSAFVKYIDQLPNAQQEEIYQQIKAHIQN
jgi:phage-related protein